jgi:hypothetical protein
VFYFKFLTPGGILTQHWESLTKRARLNVLIKRAYDSRNWASWRKSLIQLVSTIFVVTLFFILFFFSWGNRKCRKRLTATLLILFYCAIFSHFFFVNRSIHFFVGGCKNLKFKINDTCRSLKPTGLTFSCHFRLVVNSLLKIKKREHEGAFIMAVALGLFIAMSRDLCVCFDLNPRRNNIHVEIHSLPPRRPVSILDAILPIFFIILPSSLF